MDWENLNWENLCDDLIKRLPEEAGAYAVRCAPKGKPQPIQRVFEQDGTGVLCFGMTGNLQVRSRAFYSSVRGGRGHAEGERYNLPLEGEYHPLGYAQRFPSVELQIGYKICNNEHKAWEKEQAWFNEYERLFGELPPLNYGRGKKPKCATHP